MKRKITSIMLFAALLVGGASTFVSCKDTESDAVYDLNGQLSKVIEEQSHRRAKTKTHRHQFQIGRCRR